MAFSQMHRVLRPGGAVLVAFHIGDEVRHVSDWWGHAVDVDGFYLPVDLVAAEIEEASLEVQVRLERLNHAGEVATRRAYLLGRRAS